MPVIGTTPFVPRPAPAIEAPILPAANGDPIVAAYQTIIDYEQAVERKRIALVPPEEVARRFARFAWTPTQEDLDRIAPAVEAARPERLDTNESIRTQVWFQKPAEDLLTAPPSEMYRALIDQIDHANISIHAALYGVDQVPEVFEALRRARARGVDLKIVVDQNPDGSFMYPDTAKLLEEFGPSMVRVERVEQEGILHHKFFLFDNARVWTGSANIDQHAVRVGYNNEVSVLIESANLAKVFEVEHAQMWAGRFHTQKQKLVPGDLPTSREGVQISAFFSPEDDGLKSGIIPAIDKADHKIRLSLFHLADQEVTKALIRAKLKQPPVDVEVIIDSTGAENDFTKRNVQRMRDVGIKVKVENWGGKQHIKGGVIDEDTVIVGSLNWTGAGVKKNDENVLLIRGDRALAGRYVEDFDQKFASLAKFTAYAYPAAEGLNSIGTLIDGDDNQFTGNKDPLVTRQKYFDALAGVSDAAQRIKIAEGPEPALAAFKEGVELIQREVTRVRQAYEARGAELPFHLAELKKIEADIPARLELAKLVDERDEVVAQIKQGDRSALDALWTQQAVLQSQIDKLNTQKLIPPFKPYERHAAELYDYLTARSRT